MNRKIKTHLFSHGFNTNPIPDDTRFDIRRLKIRLSKIPMVQSVNKDKEGPLIYYKISQEFGYSFPTYMDDIAIKICKAFGVKVAYIKDLITGYYYRVRTYLIVGNTDQVYISAYLIQYIATRILVMISNACSQQQWQGKLNRANIRRGYIQKDIIPTRQFRELYTQELLEITNIHLEAVLEKRDYKYRYKAIDKYIRDNIPRIRVGTGKKLWLNSAI